MNKLVLGRISILIVMATVIGCVSMESLLMHDHYNFYNYFFNQLLLFFGSKEKLVGLLRTSRQHDHHDEDNKMYAGRNEDNYIGSRLRKMKRMDSVQICQNKTLDSDMIDQTATAASASSDMVARHLKSEREQEQGRISFRRGDLAVTIPGLGIKVCSGMQVRMIARAGQKVLLPNRTYTKMPFHSMPDGATVLPISSTSGNKINAAAYVYVSNSEMKSYRGGVYGLYFNHLGQVIDYKPLLVKTTRNCGGGRTPWNTWISCEEYGSGQCWQIDPTNRNPPQITQLGGTKGGNYESVAVDNRNVSRPIFFVSEDAEFGALRRYTPPPPSVGHTGSNIANWKILHESGGMTEYLMFLDGIHFTWTLDEYKGRTSQSQNYRNVEGINFHRGFLYFASKKLNKMSILNLDHGTYTASSTKFGGGGFSPAMTGPGQFLHSPDQIVIQNDSAGGNYIYLTEDGGNTVGVYSISRRGGRRYAIFEAYDAKYNGDETTGLAFSPDGRKMYAALQDCGCRSNCESGVDPSCGCLLEFTRSDTFSFDA